MSWSLQSRDAPDFALECDRNNVACIIFDANGRVSFVTRAAAEALHYTDTRQFFRHVRSVLELFSATDFSSLPELCDAAAPRACCWRVKRADGSEAAMPLVFVARAADWVCVMPGVQGSERQRDEEARLRELTDALLGGVFLTTGKIIRFANRGFAEMLGCRPEDLVGTPCADNAAPETRRMIERLTADDVKAEPGKIRELTLLARDGKARREVLARFHRVSFFGENLYLVSTHDVTDIRRSERALQDYAHRLRRVSQQLLEVQENERRNLARELHDEIGQQLTMIKLLLARLPVAHAPELEEATRAVSALLQQVRDLSLDLRPSMLDDLGLPPTLRWYMDRIARVTALSVQHEFSADFPRLKTDIETLYFRIAQEAVTNVMRHARARNLYVRLAADDDSVSLIVEDDGQGFDVQAARRSALEGGSAGLLGMQERAALVGARLKLQSSPGGGTLLRLVMARSATQREHEPLDD